MAKKRLSPQMGITIPAELRQEMNDVGEGVNWSQVAAEAFRAKVLEIKSQNGGKSMDQVIARMKAAKELESNEAMQAGLAAGKLWVEESATPKQLDRLAKEEETQGGMIGVCTNGLNSGSFVGVAEAVTGKQLDYDDARDFWSKSAPVDDFEELMGDDDYASGFVEGALKTWEIIARKMG